MAKQEQVTAYVIPDNFIEGGRILNGMFKTRNFIEGVIYALIFGAISLLIPIEGNVTARISVVCSFALPPFLIGVAGINEDPLSVFLANVLRWRKGKGLMIYNQEAQARDAHPVDMMMAEELPKDRLLSIYENWRDQRRETNYEKMKTATFEFEEDSELTKLKSAEQRAEAKLEKAARKNKNTIKAVDSVDNLDEMDIEVETYVAEDEFTFSSSSFVSLDLDDMFN